ncbi:MAG: phage tail tape measure protein [Armatimonadota bacterium]
MISDLGLGIIVSLKDAFTQNASRIQSSLQTLDGSIDAASSHMTRNLGLIEKGTMMIGAGLALLAVPAGLVASTVSTQRALGELASVGVKDFRAMEDAAESFTNQWAGASKSEFIGAAYDVKSALASLSDTAVGTFASMAALTGKATKATTQEMVETFTTAYGIFKPLMADMDDMDWAKMFSGALSETVGVFKTTGPQMAEAIKNVGAIAAASLVPMQEQMAILGQLQTTMPGSEAGTLYKAFMMKVAEAGGDLGLSFTDTQGRLKGIIPILQTLKSRFPDLSQAAVQVQLKKAFGSDEAVRFLLQMSAGLGQLEGNINLISQAMKDGTVITTQMAQAMNLDIGSQFVLVKQQLMNLAEVLGRTLLPVVTPIFGAISRFILHLQGVAKSMPGVTKGVLLFSAGLGALLVVAGSITAAIGTIGIALPAIQTGITALGSLAAGVGGAVSAAFWPVTAIIGGIILAVIVLRKAWRMNLGGIRDVVMNAWNKISLVFQGIRALISSLSSDTGQMSTELAGKLQAAGLMGFVTGVFQVYYRIREFISGFWSVLKASFGKIRTIIEPAVKMLIDAFAPLGEAFRSVLSVFGVAAGSIDASSFKNFGKTLGTIIGILVQVGAYMIKYLIYPLALAVRGIALIVQGAVWLGMTIGKSMVSSIHYIYRFFLPLRMIVQLFRLVGKVVYTVWQMITGNVSVIDGLMYIGTAIKEYLATPFEWAKDVSSTALGFIRSVISSATGSVRSAVSGIISMLSGIRITSVFTRIHESIRSAISGAFAYIRSAVSSLVSAVFQSGKSMMTTLASGIRSAIMSPYEAVKSVLNKLRRLLPFSDAKEGPLSSLTTSGVAMLDAFSSGINRAYELPADALSKSLSAMHRMIGSSLVPGMVAGTLALTPSLAGSMPNVSMPVPVVQSAASNQPVESVNTQTRLLADTRGAASQNGSFIASGQPDNVQSLISALCAKLDSISDRPIEVQVTTTLDGRKIAQAVYKDMKERRTKNYETI